MTEHPNELDQAIAAKRREVEEAARQQELKRAGQIEVARRIYAALRAAHERGLSQPNYETVRVERTVPPVVRTVRRKWPLPPKSVEEPARTVWDEEQVANGTICSVSVGDAFAFSRGSYRLTFALLIDREGRERVSAQFDYGTVVHIDTRWGQEQEEFGWRTSGPYYFEGPEAWFQEISNNSHLGSVLDATVAERAVANLASAATRAQQS